MQVSVQNGSEGKNGHCTNHRVTYFWLLRSLRSGKHLLKSISLNLLSLDCYGIKHFRAIGFLKLELKSISIELKTSKFRDSPAVV